MYVYITTGTYDFLEKIKAKNADANMILMQNGQNSLLFHESTNKSVFEVPRKYEVVESSGYLVNRGLAVFNNVPVTDEGRPVYEYRFKERIPSISKVSGFQAIRLLRPLKGDTYVEFTLWENEKAYSDWKHSSSYEEAQKAVSAAEFKSIFSGPAYFTQYIIPNEE
ncbi:antibiotic biosynthesis monooxygenase [Bacillus sp. FJAT-49736]|uniref:antibiotic biosynthesis monooxygenase family protein n=1 Tax=Bacillus sp. FJAT-49736 TaxID=2833582 RepID=UPI001BCA379C|nr:antibiotic biosynthesis monooxygenase [Bacillus sp. FJAT-49736]MBS4171966.1 antibiotic biosynthesis monooxygenase [Bacillus sp. FJAT-49736]